MFKLEDTIDSSRDSESSQIQKRQNVSLTPFSIQDILQGKVSNSEESIGRQKSDALSVEHLPNIRSFRSSLNLQERQTRNNCFFSGHNFRSSRDIIERLMGSSQDRLASLDLRRVGSQEDQLQEKMYRSMERRCRGVEQQVYSSRPDQALDMTRKEEVHSFQGESKVQPPVYRLRYGPSGSQI